MRVGSLLVKSPLRERRGFRDVLKSNNLQNHLKIIFLPVQKAF